jgi:solute:Na+ symporter, SSS family
MDLHWLDWALIISFLIISLLIALRYRATASKNLAGYFLGGRNLPWYLAGISMVATTFAADTPLAVTELVAKGGVSQNWLWWNALVGGIFTTIFFARLWRRSGVLTEVEFIGLRYSGRASKFLRIFKSAYLGLLMNALIIAWVNLALITLLEVFFPMPEGGNFHSFMQNFIHGDQSLSIISKLYYLAITAGIMLFVAFYSSLSGLKGIAVTDTIQFTIAMIGCIVLAVLVVQSDAIGGLSGLKNKLPAETFNFFPDFGEGSGGSKSSISMLTFIVFVGVLWWSSWYPGAEPGGGGYIVQRMMSAKNEKHSVFATLFYQIAHIGIRPWPWIVVGLAALVLYPHLGIDSARKGYVLAMQDFLPIGLKGLLIVSFFGAYMSTISTQLNWGASYIVNDLYKGYVKPEEKLARAGKNEHQINKHYVRMSRWTTVFIALLSLGVTTQINSISSVWEFLFQCGAGPGLVWILRWYWWRVNAWSEISATFTPFLVYGFIQYKKHVFINGLSETIRGSEELLDNAVRQIWYFDFAYGVLLSVGITTLVWLVITFITRPTSSKTLHHFVQKVKPGGIWGRYYKADNKNMPYLVIAWFSAVIMVYGFLFLVGKILFGSLGDMMVYAAAVVIGIVSFIYFAKRGKLFSS